MIKWSDFVRTNHGHLVEPQRDMMTQKMRTVGMSLIDRTPGPYDIGISRIWATNGGPEDDILKNVTWTGVVSGLTLRSVKNAGAFEKPHADQ